MLLAPITIFFLILSFNTPKTASAVLQEPGLIELSLLTKIACKPSSQIVAELIRTFQNGQILDAVAPLKSNGPTKASYLIKLETGAALKLIQIFFRGLLRRSIIEYHESFLQSSTRPKLMAIASNTCKIIEGRRLSYNKQGTLDKLAILDPSLQQTSYEVSLNPPIPFNNDPGGIEVALIDTGVNYTLPSINSNLGRDVEGKLLGFDYWDMDNRPFDADFSRSLFFPFHHGTSVASILIREAPIARIIPYRFPRHFMHRMGQLVADLDKSNARIVNLAMGSNKREDWLEFETAARARPHILFIVSAGNDNRDLDIEPVYPAALHLQNLLVVTSSNNFGQLAKGSNWGRNTVHIMVPGEHIPVIDHRGTMSKASGSSFSVPRVAALAARLIAKNQTWGAKELKDAILSKAIRSPYQSDLPLSHGWIADPTDDFLPKSSTIK